jgi:hypothetical protein
MKKKSRIQSIEQLIEIKNNRLKYTRYPYLREYLLQDIADLKQIEWLFSEKNEELKRLNADYNYLISDIKKLECTLQIFGLSEAEIFAYRLTDISEIQHLCIRAKVFEKYKTPLRFQTPKNV